MTGLRITKSTNETDNAEYITRRLKRDNPELREVGRPRENVRVTNISDERTIPDAEYITRREVGEELPGLNEHGTNQHMTGVGITNSSDETPANDAEYITRREVGEELPGLNEHGTNRFMDRGSNTTSTNEEKRDAEYITRRLKWVKNCRN